MYSSARRAPVLSVQASQYRSANVGLVPRYRPSPQHGGFTELVCVTELVVNAVSQVSAGEMVSKGGFPFSGKYRAIDFFR